MTWPPLNYSIMPKGGNFMLELATNAPKMLILGVWVSQGPWGCSSQSKMVPGHWYTVPHYATSLPGCIVGFKIPNWVKIWPEMPLKCSFWGVFWGFWAPRGPRGVQVCPRWFQATATLSHTMPLALPSNPWFVLQAKPSPLKHVRPLGHCYGGNPNFLAWFLTFHVQFWAPYQLYGRNK